MHDSKLVTMHASKLVTNYGQQREQSFESPDLSLIENVLMELKSHVQA